VIDSAAIARDIAWLAADDRDGRAIGSKGLRQASHYPIANLEEYAGLLHAARPGRRVEIVVVRDGDRVSLEAILGQRR
jgi:hypothetical protein